MENLSIQLKSKYIDYVANRLHELSRDRYEKFMKMVIVSLSSTTYADEDLVTFSISPEFLYEIYCLIGEGTSEFLASLVHKDIKNNLMPQIAALCANSNPAIATSAVWVATSLTTRSADSDNWVANQMAQGHSKLRL